MMHTAGKPVNSMSFAAMIRYHQESLKKRHLSYLLQIIKAFKRMMSQGARFLGITNMRPVLSAKVPIIKFMVDRRFEADLSFSNYLV